MLEALAEIFFTIVLEGLIQGTGVFVRWLFSCAARITRGEPIEAFKVYLKRLNKSRKAESFYNGIIGIVTLGLLVLLLIAVIS